MKVLLVDDEEQMVSTLAERLSLRGFEVSWAITGLDALAQVEIGTFNVAVLDMKMPLMSGLELKNKLQVKCPAMKFIFLTGHGSKADFKSAALDTGKEYYLIKPLDINVLVQKLREVTAI
ncbi:MAG: response regulator [Deltaproteobacteria bacterium]|nr:response regulator [Deltaproteobacteria bacterium]